jgi:DNA-binding NarL/FixJ family response regulator
MIAGGKILIVDPDGRRRASTAEWLREHRFSIAEAESDSVALDRLRQQNPDIVLLRFGPALSVDAFQQFAGVVEIHGSFIIPILDRHLTIPERAQVLALDAAGFLNDELPREELLASIRGLVRQKQTMDELKRMFETGHDEKRVETVPKPSAPLRERMPQLYKAVLAKYEEAIKQVLQRRIYKINDESFEPFRQIGRELYLANATARDAVELHYHTLRKIAPSPDAPRAQAYLEVGRTTIIGLMGDLLTFYREARREDFSVNKNSDAAGEPWRECAQQ